MDNLINFINFIITKINDGNAWLPITIIVALYLYKKEPFKIFTHFSEQAKSNIRFAKELLDSSKLSDEANRFIREKIEKITFKNLYGINADKNLRNYLIKFYEKNNSNIEWYDLKRATQYYKFDGTKIIVSITKFDKVLSWLVSGTSIVMALCGLAIMIGAFALSFHSGQPQKDIFLATIFGITIIFGAIIFNSSNWPIMSAKRLKKLTD